MPSAKLFPLEHFKGTRPGIEQPTQKALDLPCQEPEETPHGVNISRERANNSLARSGPAPWAAAISARSSARVVFSVDGASLSRGVAGLRETGACRVIFRPFPEMPQNARSGPWRDSWSGSAFSDCLSKRASSVTPRAPQTP